MKVTLSVLTGLLFANVATARTGEDCKINVYKLASPVGESNTFAADRINEILLEKGYTPVEDESVKLTHNASMAGFGEGVCTLSPYQLKKITALATIHENGTELDNQRAEDIETEEACADLDQARIKATQMLKSCADL
jgi:hypothetical protein